MSKFYLLILALPLFFLGGCKGGDSGESLGNKNLVLKADKTQIVANESEVVTFTVTDEAGKDLTASCRILQGEVELLDNTFTTKVAGTYEFLALSPESNLQSNKLTVLATAEDSVPSEVPPVSSEGYAILVNGKKNTGIPSFFGDGGDLVRLALEDKSGRDVTGSAAFLVDGEPVDGTILQKDKPGLLTVTAQIGGQEVASVKLNAKAVKPTTVFQKHLYAELFSSPWCQYCGPINQAAKELFEARPHEFFPVCIQEQGDEKVFMQGTWPSVQKLLDYYGIPSSTPQFFINRIKRSRRGYSTKEQLEEFIEKESSNAGAVAIRTVLTGTEVKVEAFVHTNKEVQGKISAVLVEDGISANTIYAGYTELIRIMRAYAPSVDGETASFSASSVARHTFSFSSSLAVNLSNCSVVVLATDEKGVVVAVQSVKVGEAVGYSAE